MVEEKGYNGYTNYETWKLCLNLDNTQWLYEESLNFDHWRDLKEWLEEMFHYKDVGYKIEDFWSYNEWNEVNWFEVFETRTED